MERQRKKNLLGDKNIFSFFVFFLFLYSCGNAQKNNINISQKLINKEKDTISSINSLKIVESPFKNSQGKALIRIYAIDSKGQKTDTLDLIDEPEKGYFNHLKIRKVSTNLKEINWYSMDWHAGESCPESYGNIVLIEKNNKIYKLFKTATSGEYGDYGAEDLYIPIKNSSGKIQLQSLDPYKNKTLPYPKNSKIPIEELLVEVEEYATCIPNKEGSGCKENKDGSPVMEILHKIVRYYQWDGNTMNLKQEIVEKNRLEYTSPKFSRTSLEQKMKKEFGLNINNRDQIYAVNLLNAEESYYIIYQKEVSNKEYQVYLVNADTGKIEKQYTIELNKPVKDIYDQLEEIRQLKTN